MKVRTRNAPSPTGWAHLGTIYQSMMDKAFAVKNGGQFILRIEDTDQSRYVEGTVEAIFEALDWFGLSPDETYTQSERLDIYKKHAKELVEKGHAYYCFCSQDRLKKVRQDQQKAGKPPMYDKHCRKILPNKAKKKVDAGEEHVIRMKIPQNEKIVVNDLIRGDIEFDSSTIDDQVILKSDGYPTYHLAVVVDDHLMEISHVVRGPEWLTSFPKHKLLYDYFGWSMPVFVHTPLITNMDGSKLSKRQGHVSVDWYRHQGFLPKAVLNFIALLGWSHPEEKEIFSFDEYVKVFDFKDLSAVSPKFDLTKLEWMNGQYLQNLGGEEFTQRTIEWLEYCSMGKNSEMHKRFLKFLAALPPDKKKVFGEINKERVKKLSGILTLDAFFIETASLDKKLLEKSGKGTELVDHINWVKSELENIDWTLESLKDFEKRLVQRAGEINWKVGEVFHPIRILICRSPVSPPLFESMWILGKDKTLERLKSN